MADINNVTLSGRLTKDAEKKTLPSGVLLISFSMANNTGFGDNEKTMFLKVNLWGKLGERLFQYLKKGKNVAVSGSIEIQKWTDQRDGTDHQQLVCNASNIILLSDGKRYDVEPEQNEINFDEKVVF